MSYKPSVPRPNDIHADSQPIFMTNFKQMNDIYGVDHVKFGNTVETATLEPILFLRSANHGLTSGDTIKFYNLQGRNSVGQIVPWTINNIAYVVTVTTVNTFTVPVDSSGFDTYIPSSGSFDVTSAFKYGLHKKLSFPSPLSTNPNRASPISSIYPRSTDETFFSTSITEPYKNKSFQNILKYDKKKITNLIWQNNSSSTDSKLLTGIEIDYTVPTIYQNSILNQFSFRTSFGLTFNMGLINLAFDTPVVFNLKKTYTTTHFTTVLTRSDPGEVGQNPLLIPQITALGLSSFTAKLTSSTKLGNFWFISIGR